MLGAAEEVAPCLAVVARDALIGPLTRALPGLRLFRKSDVVEEVIVNVLAQQISLPFAYQCKARFVAAYGPRLTVDGTTRYALPTAAILATLTPEAVRPLLTSRQKAAAMRAFGEAVSSGALDLAAMPQMNDAEAMAAKVRAACAAASSEITMPVKALVMVTMGHDWTPKKYACRSASLGLKWPVNT